MMLRLFIGFGRLRARIFSAMVRSSFHCLGKKSVLCPPVRIGGSGRISIGAKVYIGSDSWLQHVSDGPESRDPVIRIGDRVSMSGHCTVTACREVIIEEDVLIARYVHISDHSHRFDGRTAAVKDQGLTGIAPVRIRKGAWLGHGVVICPGVTIGRNAVIGANSVVKQSIPDYCVAVGAPAKVVRRPTVDIENQALDLAVAREGE